MTTVEEGTVNKMAERSNARIGVIFGGRSSEHEVSLSSAQNVIAALNDAGYTVVPIGISLQGRWLTTDPMRQLSENSSADPSTPERLRISSTDASSTWAMLPHDTLEAQLPAIDVIFPVLHGPYGEDGTIQGLLEMANLPYVGCGVLSSAAAMDKVVAKKLFAAAGLLQTSSLLVMRPAWRGNPRGVIGDIEAQASYPMFVKPANMGSSVGISRARDRSELSDAIELAALYDRKIVIEEAVPNAREIEVSVLGNDQPIASVPGEIIPGGDFYDYNAKYVDDTSELIIPARLTSEQTAQVRDMAVRAFQAVEGAGLARVDFLLNDGTGELFVNEINTMPGFTRISMYPKLWEASGISYPDLVRRLIELAFERYEDKQQNSTAR